jgi:hypothetical protein
MLLEMLSGRPPFVIDKGNVSTSDFLTKTAHVQSAPESLSRVESSVPAWLSSVVAKTLEKDKTKRFSSCSEFAEALNNEVVASEDIVRAEEPIAKRLWLGMYSERKLKPTLISCSMFVAIAALVWIYRPKNSVPAISQLSPEATQLPSQSKMQVDSDGFDAFLVWRDGRGLNGTNGVFDYPARYKLVDFGETRADSVFFDKFEEYFKDGRLSSKPTSGAIVTGSIVSKRNASGVLWYPLREGRSLNLSFTSRTAGATRHETARVYCKEIGGRLPTIRELFDFCAAGTEINKKGLFTSHRCTDDCVWSASIDADAQGNAWLFSGYVGIPGIRSRISEFCRVRCVESPYLQPMYSK